MSSLSTYLANIRISIVQISRPFFWETLAIPLPAGNTHTQRVKLIVAFHNGLHGRGHVRTTVRTYVR